MDIYELLRSGRTSAELVAEFEKEVAAAQSQIKREKEKQAQKEKYSAAAAKLWTALREFIEVATGEPMSKDTLRYTQKYFSQIIESTFGIKVSF